MRRRRAILVRVVYAVNSYEADRLLITLDHLTACAIIPAHRPPACTAFVGVSVSFMDLLLILLFAGALATGFFQGAVRLIVVILAFYLALVLASLYYPALGEFFVRNFRSERFVGQYVAFFLVLFFSFILLAIAGLYTFRYFRMPGALEYVDRVVGTVLGLLFGAFIVGVVAALLWNLMIVRGGRSIDLPVFQWLGNSVANSFVLQYFATVVLPLIYGFLDPILPDGANLIFAVQ